MPLDLNMILSQLSDNIPELKSILHETEVVFQVNTYINERVLSILLLMFTISTGKLNNIIIAFSNISYIPTLNINS